MRAIIFLLSIILLMGCEDKVADKNICTLKGSIDEVPWLAEMKNSITNCSCETSIIQGTYNKQTVFYKAITDPLCNSINLPTLYNCEGVIIRTFTNSKADQEELSDKVTRDEILYTCET